MNIAAFKKNDANASRTSRLIGIVTVLFNSDDVLPGFFESLSRQREVCYRLYVIDNSKTDSGSRISRELASRHGIDAEVVFNDANVGVAQGNNQGIAMARRDGCEWILLANNDIEFESPNLLLNLMQQMSEQGFEAIVPKIYFYGLIRKIWFAGGRFSVFRATTPHIGEGEDDRGQYDGVYQIEYAPTCFMMLHSRVFEKIGVMDEKYFVYYDDCDFLWRMRRAGMRLGFAPLEVVQHKVSYSTGGQDSEFTLYYGARNRLYFIRKHYGLVLSVVSLSYFFVTRLLKGMKMKAAQRSAMWRGVRDGLRIAI